MQNVGVGEHVGALFLCMGIPLHMNTKKERRERKMRREEERNKIGKRRREEKINKEMDKRRKERGKEKDKQ
jgi:hypothetical protein